MPDRREWLGQRHRVRHRQQGPAAVAGSATVWPHYYFDRRRAVPYCFRSVIGTSLRVDAHRDRMPCRGRIRNGTACGSSFQTLPLASGSGFYSDSYSSGSTAYLALGNLTFEWTPSTGASCSSMGGWETARPAGMLSPHCPPSMDLAGPRTNSYRWVPTFISRLMLPTTSMMAAVLRVGQRSYLNGFPPPAVLAGITLRHEPADARPVRGHWHYRVLFGLDAIHLPHRRHQRFRRRRVDRHLRIFPEDNHSDYCHTLFRQRHDLRSDCPDPSGLP